MGDVSKNFNRSEFACKCGCEYATVDVELLRILEDVRERFDSAVKINSGCRCPAHNKRVGGSVDSEHTRGIAADIVVDGVPAHEVHTYLSMKYPGRYGMRKYQIWTHVDVRQRAARWSK